jgi:alkylhydroperoxidase family enzyme
LSKSVLKGEDDLLPARGAALAGFAAVVTSRPWALTPDIGARLAAAGVGAGEVEAAAGVVAMFNYLTRVADASGIELDYASELPGFQPERAREPAPRPGPDRWPVVAAGFRTFPGFPALSEAWRAWREYVFDSDEPLTRGERRLLARAAAQECCDGGRAGELSGYAPREGSETSLDAFARKLSRRPWQMEPADLQRLRDAGFSEPALLHAISVVALQNAESRLAMGRALTGA